MTIAELTEQADTINSDRQEDYLALAKRLSIDENAATPEEIATILQGAGKDGAELQRLVCALQERCRIRERISTIPKLRDRQRELRHKIELENQLLETSIRTHGEKTAPIQRELFDLEKTLAESSTWQSELRLACPDISLRERLKTLERQAPFLRADVTKLQNEISQIDLALSQENNEKLQNARRRVEVSLKAAREASAENWREAEEIAKMQIEF